MTGEIEELIAASRPQRVRRCWREELTGKADEYMTAIEQIRAAEGADAVVGTNVHQILSEKGWTDIGVHRVREHLAGRCPCRK